MPRRDDRMTTAELIELVRNTREKVQEAAHELETLTHELRKRLEAGDE